MAEHDHWLDRGLDRGLDRPAGGTPGGVDRGSPSSITRLESALARIAAAAGRRQDALRVAELTARAAQHEADLLVQAEQQRRSDAAASAAAEAAALEQDRLARLRETAERLDSLITRLRSELEVQRAGD